LTDSLYYTGIANMTMPDPPAAPGVFPPPPPPPLPVFAVPAVDEDIEVFPPVARVPPFPPFAPVPPRYWFEPLT
jgi:hypothetical protein